MGNTTRSLEREDTRADISSRNAPTFSSRRNPSDDHELRLQSQQGLERRPTDFPRQLRIGFGHRLGIAADAPGDISLVSDGFDGVIIFVAIGEAEAIAGEQKIDDLPPAVAPDHASSRGSVDDPEPAIRRLALATDVLPARTAKNRSQGHEGVELLRAAGHRLTNAWGHRNLPIGCAQAIENSPRTPHH